MRSFTFTTLALSSLLAFSACKKSDDASPSNNPDYPAAQTFTVTDTAYTATVTENTSGGFYAINATNYEQSTAMSRTLVIRFKTKPTASKTYVIGTDTDFLGTRLVNYSTIAPTTTQEFGKTGEKVEVTVDGAKLTFKFKNHTPQTDPPSGTYVRKLSGNVTFN